MVITTRLDALPAGARTGFDLEPLRQRWRDARYQYDLAKQSGGEIRKQHEEQSRAALQEVQDGLLDIITRMNERFAGHPPPS